MDNLIDIIKRWTSFRATIGSPNYERYKVEESFDHKSFRLSKDDSYFHRRRQDIDSLMLNIEAWETEKAKSSRTFFMNKRQRAIFAADGIEVKKMSEITEEIRKNKEALIAGYIAFKAKEDINQKEKPL